MSARALRWLVAGLLLLNAVEAGALVAFGASYSRTVHTLSEALVASTRRTP